MPYPNEHAARLRKPNDFDPKTFRRTHGSGDGRIQGVKVPTTIDVIWGKLKGKSKPKDPVLAQALRFPITRWTEAQARKWLKDNKIKTILFEPAKKNNNSYNAEKSKEGGLIMNDRNIFLFEHFETEMANRISQRIIELNAEDSKEPIKIYINSVGGSVLDLFAILDTMRSVPAPVYTIVLGKAMSAGAILFASGDKRFVGENSRIMIHEGSTCLCGDVQEVKENLAEANKWNDRMFQILSQNIGKSVEEIKSDVWKKDKYFNAQEAIDYGIADEIFTDEIRQKFKLNEKLSGIQHSFKLSEDTNKLSEAMLFKVGDYQSLSQGNFNLSETDLLEINNNFKNNVRGIDISVENTHDNDAGEKPAWGWIKKLFFKNENKELWGGVSFTDNARKSISNGEYKYISPEFFNKNYVNEKGERFNNVLVGASLTNRPFQKGEPIKLSEKSVFQIKELEVMDKESMIKKLSEEHKIDVNALLKTNDDAKKLSEKNKELEAELKKIKSDVDGKKEVEGENADLKKTVSDLSDKIEGMEKKTVFENIKSEGKVAEGMKDACFSQFKTAEDMKKFYADAPKVIHTKAIGDSGEKDDKTLTDAEMEVMKSDPSLKEEDILKARKI